MDISSQIRRHRTERDQRGAWTRFVAALRALGPWVRMLLLWGFFRGVGELAMPLVMGILDALGI